MKRTVGKYEIHSVTFHFFGHTVSITQRYCEKYNRGHYVWAVKSVGGNDDLIATGQTSRAPPSGKVSQAEAKHLYEYALKNYEEWVEFAEEDYAEANKCDNEYSVLSE